MCFLSILNSYSLLCEAVDKIAENGSRLHNIMGLPSRYVGLKGDETSSEQESQSAESPGTLIGKRLITSIIEAFDFY